MLNKLNSFVFCCRRSAVEGMMTNKPINLVSPKRTPAINASKYFFSNIAQIVSVNKKKKSPSVYAAWKKKEVGKKSKSIKVHICSFFPSRINLKIFTKNTNPKVAKRGGNIIAETIAGNLVMYEKKPKTIEYNGKNACSYWL